MNIVAMNVRRPSDDVLGMAKLLRFGAHVCAINRANPCSPCFRTNISRQLGRAQPIEKPPVHGAIAEFRQVPCVGIREDRFAAELSCNALKPARDLIERFIPRDTLETLRNLYLCGSDTALQPMSCRMGGS